MQKINKWSKFGKLFLITWAILCITLFIFSPGRISVLHSSFLFDWEIFIPKLSRIEPLNYIKNILWAFFGAAVFSLSCTSLGAIFINLLWNKKNEGFPPRPAGPILAGSAFLIGSGIFSAIFLILGGLYKLTSFGVIIVMFCGLILGFHAFILLIKTNSQDHSFNFFDETKGSDRLIYWLSVSIVLLSLMYSSSRLSYDSVALYFSNVKITAMTNHIYFFQNDSFIASSFHTGILYVAVSQVFGDQASRMYSWINGLIIIIFTLALGEQVGLSKQARQILLALLLTTSAFTDLLGDGKIDLATSAPAIAAVYWMVANGAKAGKKSFFLVGFLAGLAIISRPFNAILLGIFFTFFYLQQIYFQRKNGDTDFKFLFTRFFWLTSALMSLAAFHLMVNWMILGDPLAAFTNASKLSTSGWQWSFDPNEIWIFRAFYPFVVTFLNSPQSLGTISPLFLAFLPSIFIKEIRKNLSISTSLTKLTIVAIITLMLWITFFFTIVEIRYVFFLWIILFMPLAVIAEKVLSINDNTSKTMELMLIAVLLFMNFRIAYISLDTYSPIDKQGNPHCYDHLFCDYLKSINDGAAPGERVLTLDAYRYYLRSDLFACSTKVDEYSAIHDALLKSPDIFWKEVYRQGYKYVAYEKNYSVRHLYMDFIPSPENTPQWISLEPIYGKPGDPVVAYKINANNPPIAMEQECRQNKDNVWEISTIK